MLSTYLHTPRANKRHKQINWCGGWLGGLFFKTNDFICLFRRTVGVLKNRDFTVDSSVFVFFIFSPLLFKPFSLPFVLALSFKRAKKSKAIM